MKNEIETIDDYQIQNKIYSIRGKQIMIDRDLADLYQVETKVLNQAVKRNLRRFPKEFMFQLSKDEFEYWKSQIVTSNKEIMGLRKKPYAFTEQGVSMLSAVLKSDIAIDVSIKIMNSFISMRKIISNNSAILSKFDKIEQKQLLTDNKIEKIFEIIEAKEIKQEEGIFYKGKVFDAYAFIAKLIKEANKSVILVDNYIDERVLLLLSKRKDKCKAIIYTEKVDEQLKLDLDKHHEQYRSVEIKIIKKIHDRFLILDKNEIYHNGASIKNLGESLFAITRMDRRNLKIFDVLKEAKDYK